MTGRVSDEDWREFVEGHGVIVGYTDDPGPNGCFAPVPADYPTDDPLVTVARQCGFTVYAVYGPTAEVPQ